MLVETNSLAELSPSLIAHSPLLYFSGGVLTFDAVVDTWLDKAPTQHNLSAMRYVQYTHIDSLFPCMSIFCLYVCMCIIICVCVHTIQTDLMAQDSCLALGYGYVAP